MFAHANAPLFSFYFLVSVASDTTITGWVDVVHTVYNEIGGYRPCLSFVIFYCSTHVPYILFAVKSLSPQPKAHGLLEASPCELGAPKPYEFSCAFGGVFFILLLFADLHFCRVTTWRWLLKSVASMKC
jgi:hypothetical protein